MKQTGHTKHIKVHFLFTATNSSSVSVEVLDCREYHTQDMSPVAVHSRPAIRLPAIKTFSLYTECVSALPHLHGDRPLLPGGTITCQSNQHLQHLLGHMEIIGADSTQAPRPMAKPEEWR